MSTQVPRYQIPLVNKDGQVTREWNTFFGSVGGSVRSFSTEDVLLITVLLNNSLKAVLFNNTAEAAFQ